MGWRSIALAAVLGICVTASTAPADKPSDTKLVLAGMAMGIPTYMIGVSVHEGSHALAATFMSKVQVIDYSLIPGFHPDTDKFYFGYVTVRGLRSDAQRAWFHMAPKLTDTLLLTGFAALYASDAMPENAYGQTAMLVLATGFWVDFSRDIIAFWDHNDTVKTYNLWGLDSEWKRLPARLVHVGISAALGYSIYRGYRDLFADAPAGDTSERVFLMPLADLSF